MYTIAAAGHQWLCLRYMQLVGCAGTSLRYKPGVIICGGGLVHDCGTSRGIGYFLEALVLLALFAKKVNKQAAAVSTTI